MKKTAHASQERKQGVEKQSGKSTNRELKKSAAHRFHSRRDGLFILAEDSDDEGTKICSAIKVLYKIMDSNGRNPAYYLNYMPMSGSKKKLEVPFQLVDPPANLKDYLTAAGIIIEPTPLALKSIAEYLRESCPDDVRVRLLTEGWTEKDQGESGYAMGDRLFTGADGKNIAVVSVDIKSHFASAGTMKDWLEFTKLCKRNPLAIFMLSAAFLSPLLTLLDLDSSIVMLVGRSSTGKSTLLRLANSLFKGYGDLETWEGTANGMEALACSYKDTVLCLDENDQCDIKVLGDLAYRLSNSAGKKRATSGGSLVKTDRTRTVILSSGEQTAIGRLHAAGMTTKQGQEVRYLTIPVREKYGVFSDLHGMTDSGEFVDEINRKIRSTYGLAWPKCVEHVAKIQLGIQSNYDEVKEKIRNFIKSGIEIPPKDFVIGRVLDKFSVIAFAGFTAIDAGAVAWEQKDVVLAARHCFNLWFDDYCRVRADPDDALMDELRNLLSVDGQKLPPLFDYNDASKYTQLAFLHDAQGDSESEILIVPAVLEQKFRGKTARLVDVLRNSAYAILDSRGCPKKQVHIPGTNRPRKRELFFALRLSFLGE